MNYYRFSFVSIFFFVQGTAGDPVNIIANYIKILTKPQWELFQYHIEFTPDVENKRFRREIIAQHRV
jgi:aubergine-like protein